MNIAEKVSFNIASEASYIYILSGQNSPKLTILGIFKKTETWGETVLPDMAISIGQKKNGENAKKLKCDILSGFQILCNYQKSVFNVCLDNSFEKRISAN